MLFLLISTSISVNLNGNDDLCTADMILSVCMILCVMALLCLLHTYVFFPLLMRGLLYFSSDKKQPAIAENELPHLSILIAAHNEVKVIGDKLQSIIDNQYPEDKLEILVGSDSSTDGTDEQVDLLSKKFPCIKLFRFNNRSGKPAIINQLANQSVGTVLVITDANVFFDKDTLRQLAMSFKNNSVGLADTRMVNTGLKKSGISHQEKAYISSEVVTKYAEGKIWGCMMGPFGGCYAVRKELYQPVPEKNLVDDFYVSMKVLEQGYQCVSNPDAVVYEEVSNNLKIEYHRKTRIATGNFQNLKAFSHLLWKGKGIGFCFLSHKVLRWLGPLFLITVLICSGIMVLINGGNLFFEILFTGISLSLLMVLFDRILNLAGIHLSLLRLNTHFIVMNIALLKGLIRYLKGVNSGVWQPTERHQ
ncbi:MAG TPA: glycosyltransferase [Bacteroidia bacterium]|nr:glycosyltransferase [Bacteroidota bacterium]MCW5932435.1 glycosyltransferase [Bacteroidota bacterium]HNR49405.1 glycosyltransferase [Bacteroidia bacterium]HNT81836.1 glycosyltransferase [Bacteroidia bacterium]